MTAWPDRTPSVDLELVALLTQVRDVARVALGPNGTTWVEQDLSFQGLDSLAHTVVNTARIGIAKPDPRVYRIAAERVGACRAIASMSSAVADCWKASGRGRCGGSP
ncbi:hypothetical protein ABZ153_09600 [Streptomyces sp. NPDC006290]|uniref:hypothetical protein n=1 Tax=Streptomyces sp. NPDC006290 TaxID=3156745 RepID=UPI0033BF6855